MENILACWDEFKKGKSNKPDVLEFERHLEDNIFGLRGELLRQTYRHGPYAEFHIHDPKHRIIHKASVRDRLVHHIVFRELYKIFDPTFIYHSYSSREGKGTHLAVSNLARALGKASNNCTGPAYVLKCDIRKFFHSVPHRRLFGIIKNRVDDPGFLRLVWRVISSFSMPVDKFPERERELRENFQEKRGLPIGNLTSQIFANIFLDKFDWFIKKQLGIRHYFRYADDFAIVHPDPAYLKSLLGPVREFLGLKLGLDLHPRKVEIRKFGQGIDFLGYVVLPHYTALRTKTKRRMLKKISELRERLDMGLISRDSFEQSLQSYRGMLRHCSGHKIGREISRIVRKS